MATIVKTFRTKRDTQDWSRCTEDEMVCGVYIPAQCLGAYDAQSCPQALPERCYP